MFYTINLSIKLTEQEYKQYAKQIILNNIGIHGQQRLHNAKILIIGLGGLGCPALLYLIASGIHNISIIDDDQVDLSNLNRQILYNMQHLNNQKTLCAQSVIKQINPRCNLHIYNKKLNHNNAYLIIKKYDIILDATDNFKTRYIIDETCYKLHKIHIYGAINQYEGHVSVFNYRNNVRYIDLYPKILNLKEFNCEENGILGVMSGIVGLLQATEAIKIILGIGTILSGYILKYNLLTTKFTKIQCHPIKKKNPYISKQTLYHEAGDFLHIKRIQNQEYYNSIILDIRNRLDFQYKHINKSINIPANQFQINKTIKFIISHLNQYTIIVSCNKSTTALTIAKLLNKHHIQTYILKNK